MKKLIIYGAGKLARDALDIIERINQEKPSWELLGFIDDNKNLWGSYIDGYPVSDPVHTLSQLKEDFYIICCIVDPKARAYIVKNRIQEIGLKLTNLIAPSVRIPKDVEIGLGTMIWPGVHIGRNVKLGSSNLIFFNTILAHDLNTGDYATILASVTISGHCKIGNQCLLGAGVTLHPNVSVGDGSTVGIGTTLTKSVEAHKTVYDLPRQILMDKP